jgi:Tol biopolymer transport system component
MPERSGPTPKPSIYLDTGSFTETDGHFSPDGRWVVYSSNESQRYEVYVTAFPDSRGKRQISIDGGITPRWRGDGKEIYYIDPNSTLMAAEIINKGGSLEVGQIRPVARGFINQRGYLFDASKDGTRFLSHVLRGAPREDAFSEPLTLISNWPALLKK